MLFYPHGQRHRPDKNERETIMSTKFYIGQINSRCGEFEYSEVFRFSTATDPEEYLDDIAADYYAPGIYEAQARTGGYQEISEEMFTNLHLVTQL